MSPFLDHPVVVLCACTTTLLLSVLAVTVASYETKTGRSRNPLETDPRHRRHRRQQRVRCRVQGDAGTGRPEAYDVIADVAREVREATAQSGDVTVDDHEAVARTILPAASRLRRPARSQDLTPDQRRVVFQFRRRIERYTLEEGCWSTAGDRDDLRDTLHRTACHLHRAYNSETTEVPYEFEAGRHE